MKSERILLIFILLFLFSNIVYAVPVALWHFDECNGTTVYDATGNGNNGGFVGNPTWTIDSISGCALHFDGFDDYILMTNAPAINTQVRLEAWVRRDSSADGSIISKNAPYYLGIVDNKVSGRAYNGGNWVIVPGTTNLSIGQWYLIAMSYDGSYVRVFLNGIEENLAPQNGSMPLGSLLTMGWGEPGVNFYFNGTIDEALIDNNATFISPVLNLLPIGNKIVTEGQQLSIQLQVGNINSSTTLTFNTNAASILPSQFSFNQNTGLFQWTPTFTDYGNYTVTFNVTNGLLTDEETIIISVLDAQTAVLVPIGATIPGNTVPILISDSAAPGEFYIAAMSTSNNPPFTLSDGRTIYLEPNAIFFTSIFFPSILGLSTSIGMLSNYGNAIAYWTVPNIPALSGTTVYLGFVSIKLTLPVPTGIISISNVASLTII